MYVCIQIYIYEYKHTDLVGEMITIRSAYKGMHQEGNKSGARRESICFHLHGRDAKMGRRENVRAEGE